MCYGYAAEIRDEVVDYLDFREKDGYDRESVDVHLRMEGAPDGTCRPEPSLHGAAREANQWLAANLTPKMVTGCRRAGVRGHQRQPAVPRAADQRAGLLSAD
jgi:hypothetical protein